MKKIFLFAVAAAAVGAASAAEPQKRVLTPEERAALIYQHTGGMVEKARSGKAVAIVDTQGGAYAEAMAAAAKSITEALQLPVVVETADVAAGGLERSDIGFAVYLMAGGPKIATAPLDGWAAIDVAWLASDGASAEVVGARVQKQIWRAFVYGMGGGNSMFPHCIMKPIFTLAELDANPALMACPENYGKVGDSAQALGIEPTVRTTYLNACQEGWAPAPTNEYQSAIWERVKAEQSEKPSNPIRIVPGQKPQGR